MKRKVSLLLVFVLLQLVLLNTNVFAQDGTFAELNNVTLSENEVLETFYKDTQARIDNIHNTSGAISPSNGGNAYYVSNSGNDNNDGLSPDRKSTRLNSSHTS